MGKGLNKILGGAAAVGGAYLLGSTLFPETFGGGSAAFNLSGSNVGPTMGGVQNLDLGSAGSSSIFQNPTVLSSGILAGTSLLGGLFGGQADEDALKAQQAITQQQFDAEMAYKQAALAQALEIAKINAAASGGGGGGGQGAAIAAQLKIARAKAIENNAAMKAQALQLPLQYDNRAATAQNTGAQSGSYFNNLAQVLQAPALRSA